jgi:ABC-2 type transport system ATP-binding protein
VRGRCRRVEIFGVDARQAAARARLAYLPERFSPPHYLLGREFLAMTLALAGARFDAARAAAMADELELEAQALERPVRQLSKGMAQKLGLAACFLQERDLYMLDEPMSGLDPSGRLAVKAVLARLHAAGRALFFTSHVLSVVEELCSTIAVLDRGRLRFRGAPAELRGRYGEDNLERAFLKCVRSDATPLQSAPEGRPRLLIVDDDALITDTLAFALGADFEVLVCESRPHASNCCASCRSAGAGAR